MDKYEFNIKVEQIKKLVNKGDYETAMKIADTIDWRRVRSTSLLTTIAQVYERNAEYQDAKDILLLAFERAPIGKGLLFKLTDLALREGNVPEAGAYYREFCDLAVDDPRQNLLRFLILEAKGATIEQLIHSLEKYCQEELDEKWMYHLAELYQQAGMETQCVNMCDRIMLMFGLGKYVDKAMELKLQFAPLTKYQMDLVENREKYEEKLRAVEEKYNSRTLRREPEEEEEYFDSEDAEEADMNGLDMDERMDAHDENRHRAASRNMDSEDDGMYPEEEQMYPEESDFLEDDLVSSLHEAKAEEELAKKNDEELTIFRRRNIGFIFQNYNLVPILNVYENIVLPVELDGDMADEHFLEEIVYLLGLEDKLKNMPNNLSGGQQQRVAIARALITKPAIVLADEPTGNLDSKTSAEVLGLIKRTSAEFHQTVVMITHNNDIARLADRIIRIEDGKIVD